MNDIQIKFPSRPPAHAIPEIRSQAESVTTTSLSSLNNPRLDKRENLLKERKNESQSQESVMVIQERLIA